MHIIFKINAMTINAQNEGDAKGDIEVGSPPVRLREKDVKMLADVLEGVEQRTVRAHVDFADRTHLPSDTEVQAVNDLVRKVASGELEGKPFSEEDFT